MVLPDEERIFEMRKLLAASILVHAAILGAPASATPVQLICTIDVPTTIPIAVWLPAGNICYVKRHHAGTRNSTRGDDA
jgi:hypothetical protein